MRRDRQRCSTDARQRINDKRSVTKFELLLATNFGPGDKVVTLTYREDRLPGNLDQAKKQVKKFIRLLRKSFRLAGVDELKYLGVHEGKHGDHRFHHHMILNGVPGLKEMVQSLWAENGEIIDFADIDLKSYHAWSVYLCKELLTTGRLQPGQHAWTRSANLLAPIVEQGVCPDHMSISPPPGSVILENEQMQTEFGEVHFIRCILPAWAVQQRTTKPPRKKAAVKSRSRH